MTAKDCKHPDRIENSSRHDKEHETVTKVSGLWRSVLSEWGELVIGAII